MVRTKVDSSTVAPNHEKISVGSFNGRTKIQTRPAMELTILNEAVVGVEALRAETKVVLNVNVVHVDNKVRCYYEQNNYLRFKIFFFLILAHKTRV